MGGHADVQAQLRWRLVRHVVVIPHPATVP
jgi:hypothetical protein